MSQKPDRRERENQDGTTDGEGMTRRRLLTAGAATWTTVALAGCPQGSTDNDTDGEDQADPTSTATPEPQPENYVVTAETGTGSSGIPESAGFASACSPTTRFVPGMQVIFYIGIFDPETGDQLTDEDIGGVSVNVDGGPTVELGWAGDDEENPAQEWAGSWTIPEDTEPGSMSYTVEVSNGDANYRNVGILENSIDIIEYSDPTNYVVTNHTYAISAPEEDVGFVGACGPERQFTADMKVGFLVGVYDSSTGEVIGNDTLDAVTIEFPDESFGPVELSWAGDDEEHPADEWGGSLDTPSDIAPGTYSYTINVTNGADNIYNVGIAANEFTIIEV